MADRIPLVVLAALTALVLLPAGAAERDPAGPDAAGRDPAAEEPVLPTRTLSQLLGASPVPGLEPLAIEIAMWDGTLNDLVRALADLGGPGVVLGPGVRGDTSIVLVAEVPVTAARAAEALALAAERAGYTVARDTDPWELDYDEGAELLDTVYIAVQPFIPGAAEFAAQMWGSGAPGVAHRDLPELEIALMAMASDDMAALLGLSHDAGERSPPDDRGVVEVEPGSFAVPREALADLTEQPFRAASLRPRGSRGGSDDGFTLARVDPHGPLFALGLRDGDVLTLHDGVPLGSYPDLEAALRALMTESAVTLTLLRGGEPRVLHYQVDGPPLEVPPLWGVDTPTDDELRAHHGVVLEGRDVAVVPRSYVRGMRNTLARQIRWNYVLDDQGQVRGVTGSGRDGDLLSLIGLRGGTRILAVDDRPIVDPTSLMTLFTALRSQDEVVLTLEGRLREEHFTIRLTGDPDLDPEPWPLDVLTVRGVREQLRAERGIEIVDGVHVVPRAVVADLARTELTFRPVHDDAERVAGYRLIGSGYGDLPDLLGVVPGTTLGTLDGEPIENEDDVHALLEAWLTAGEVHLGGHLRDGTAVELRHRLTGEPAPVPGTWIGTGIDVEPNLQQRRRERGVEGGLGQFQVPATFVGALRGEITALRPRRDQEGTFTYLLSRVGNRTAWFVLGLRTGDTIVGCNGAPLTARDDLAAALDALLDGEPLELHLIRGEEPIAVLMVLSPG